ncbi:MAG: sigma 54-interacting transcriptional regulator [Planctomycetes bacterium]|nr:sigma 54-interacting transcriptional regulator [Planctomycetota bacterium]
MIVGHSPGIRKALQTIRLVAASDLCPVLIIGETGTGKELAAQAVHVLRGGNPESFVAVNCAALTANLLESELFGHAKGAFTGADREKTGLFELAGDGTIFLDEISEMPMNLQAKLLRVVQEKKFRKVGGTKDITCRATIIASSNRQLAREAREGHFRPDLYYRLATFPIVLPPLGSEERRPDIPLLAEYFIETLGADRGTSQTLSPEAAEFLMNHNWPGNVRELRNVIERALIIERGPEITPASLMTDLVERSDTPPDALAAAAGDFSLETAERLFITRALQETGWQRTRAAALLGITRATLHAKLKRYKITFPDASDAGESAVESVRRLPRLEESRL